MALLARITSDVTSTDEARATLGRPAAAYRSAPRQVGYGAARRLRPSQCPAVLQRKPIIDSRDGPDEREADAVADAVLAMAAPVSAGPAHAKVQRKCTGCAEEEEKAIQAKSTSGTDGGVPADVGAAASAAQQGGVALPRETIAYFGPRFGHDFSGVRVHAGGDAANAARAVHAVRGARFGADFDSVRLSPSAVAYRVSPPISRRRPGVAS
jgi:hypothetical protein